MNETGTATTAATTRAQVGSLRSARAVPVAEASTNVIMPVAQSAAMSGDSASPPPDAAMTTCLVSQAAPQVRDRAMKVLLRMVMPRR